MLQMLINLVFCETNPWLHNDSFPTFRIFTMHKTYNLSWSNWNDLFTHHYIVLILLALIFKKHNFDLKVKTTKLTFLIPYRRTHFTPPGAKYLILDDFHFHIDPQIINYNGLSFHTSMGLPELGRAAVSFCIHTLELINFVCFTFHTSPLKI
jgi:hypothetical protein